MDEETEMMIPEQIDEEHPPMVGGLGLLTCAP